MSEKYNGWTNYETWAAKLWIDNDQGSYHWAIDEAKEADSTYDLGQTLKAEIEEGAPSLENSLYSDLLNGALSEINWYEIAEAYLEEIEEPVEV